MRKLFTFIFLIITTLPISAQKPNIAVIGTGGTIAGTAESATRAGYSPAQLTVNAILNSAPQIGEIANVTAIQLCNISSQAMNNAIWLKLAHTIDSLFASGNCDGVVITHGTDTMEETAYFLNLTIKYGNPIILVGAMRPATGLSADGPMNLFNAVSLATKASSHNKGVMILMNDFILSADDVTKTNSVNTNAFECPNYGPLGVMRGGEPIFFREPLLRNTINSEFSITSINSLPKVDIVYSYADADATAFDSFIEKGAKGVVIAGVGHGNFSPAIGTSSAKAAQQGIAVVRSTRIIKGGVTNDLEEPFSGQIASYYKSPQKSRILLMVALTKTNDFAEIQRIFREY